ncbi:MAG: CoA transferase [Gammaproteobacteria bacterium]|nr:CoA transferase [Gammaproteobacteria bacterium]
MAGEGPLLFDGLKVVDAGSWIAGPVSATMLADFGADVVKVEMPGDGDPYRRLALAPATPNADINYAWAQDARGKRSITLNVKAPEGQEVLKRLVAECDVYVTNYPLHMRRRLGLTYEDLKPINQRMIYASLTAYGEQGPEKDREGFDLVAYWSRSGLMDVVRSPGAQPAPSLPGMGDHPTAVALYAGIVTALLHRERTGEGGMVHTSLIANGVWAASCIAAARFAHGSDFSNYPNPSARPFTRELYETADGRWLQFTMVRSDEERGRLLDVLGAAALLGDPRYASQESRLAHATEIAAKLRPIVSRQPAAHWLAALAEAAVPVSMVGKIDDLASDEQLTANNVVMPPADDIAADYVINHPVNVDAVRRRGIRRAPEPGEHTDAVLAELGFDSETVADYRARGVV